MFEILTGKTSEHVVALGPGSKSVHCDMVEPWRLLVAAAAREGFEPTVISGFRDFSAQLNIWNGKVRGERPVLDSDSLPLEVKTLSPDRLISAILRWSALPGTSRHHWGTDIDVIDARALRPGMKVELITEEFVGEGPFAPLHSWLDTEMQRFGFYRPYADDRGGVAPERWHLSYAPIATDFFDQYGEEVMVRAIAEAEIDLKPVLLSMSSQIYTRFVRNVAPAP